MSTDEHKSMKAIAGRLQDALQDLEDGALDFGRVDEMCEEARELYERLVVLRFKAMEEEMGVASTKGETTGAGPDDRLIHPNQTSLIDAIAAASVPVQEKLFDVQIDVESITEAEPEPVAKEEIVSEDIEEIVEEETEEDTQAEVDEDLQKPAPTEFGLSFSVASRENNEIGGDDDVEEEVLSELEEEETVEEEVEVQPIGAVDAKDTSINDRLSSGRREMSLADKLGMTPIPDLKKAISLNQKFLFINELFDSEDKNYHEAISEINSFSSFAEAWNYLELNCGAAGWNMEEEVVEQFVELLERRFIA